MEMGEKGRERGGDVGGGERYGRREAHGAYMVSGAVHALFDGRSRSYG